MENQALYCHSLVVQTNAVTASMATILLYTLYVHATVDSSHQYTVHQHLCLWRYNVIHDRNEYIIIVIIIIKKVKKKVKERIVLREIHLRTTGRHLSNGITVLSATRQRWPPRLHPNRAGWYSIYRPRKDERLSWPSWLVTYRHGLPARRRSPIRVLTGSDVAQLRWSKPTRYH